MTIKFSDYLLEQSISNNDIHDIELQKAFAEMNVYTELAEVYTKHLLIQEGLPQLPNLPPKDTGKLDRDSEPVSSIHGDLNGIKTPFIVDELPIEYPNTYINKINPSRLELYDKKISEKIGTPNMSNPNGAVKAAFVVMEIFMKAIRSFILLLEKYFNKKRLKLIGDKLRHDNKLLKYPKRINDIDVFFKAVQLFVDSIMNTIKQYAKIGIAILKTDISAEITKRKESIKNTLNMFNISFNKYESIVGNTPDYLKSKQVEMYEEYYKDIEEMFNEFDRKKSECYTIIDSIDTDKIDSDYNPKMLATLKSINKSIVEVDGYLDTFYNGL